VAEKYFYRGHFGWKGPPVELPLRGQLNSYKRKTLRAKEAQAVKVWKARKKKKKKKKKASLKEGRAERRRNRRASGSRKAESRAGPQGGKASERDEALAGRPGVFGAAGRRTGRKGGKAQKCRCRARFRPGRPEGPEDGGNGGRGNRGQAPSPGRMAGRGRGNVLASCRRGCGGAWAACRGRDRFRPRRT
jgi:hypothetical protein